MDRRALWPWSAVRGRAREGEGYLSRRPSLCTRSLSPIVPTRPPRLSGGSSLVGVRFLCLIPSFFFFSQKHAGRPPLRLPKRHYAVNHSPPQEKLPRQPRYQNRTSPSQPTHRRRRGRHPIPIGSLFRIRLHIAALPNQTSIDPECEATLPHPPGQALRLPLGCCPRPAPSSPHPLLRTAQTAVSCLSPGYDYLPPAT